MYRIEGKRIVDAETEEVVATLRGDDKKLFMTQSNADKRPLVEEWLLNGEEAPTVDDEPEVMPPSLTKEAPMALPPSKGIPPCPPRDPASGDKTPEVVAWFFKYHPKEAEERYKNRRVQRPQ